jgi:outer membrane protein OmpA-like peptidoglycan-associated protein
LNQAELALKEAEAVRQSSADEMTVEHHAYLAEQRARIALQLAELRTAEAAIATANELRSKVLLEARERELEAARARTAQETREAELARDQAAQQAQKLEQARQNATAYAREAQEAQQRAQALSAQTRQLEAQLAELKAQQTERGWVLTLGGDVLFDVNEATLKPGAKRALDNLAQFMQQYPQRNVSIEGFTDSTGSDQYNEALSERRAQAVKDALVARGIGANRISVRGYGEAFPVATNDTTAGRQLNRRVEVVISRDGNQVGERRQ